MTAPDRIRVAQDADGFWTCREAVSGSQEYVRADLYAALEVQLAERGKPFIAAAEEAYWLLAWTWQSHLTGPGKPFDMSIFAPEARDMMTKAEQDLFDALSEIERLRSSPPTSELEAENARLKARLAEALEALEPFALVAEHYIGDDEADSDMYRPMARFNRAPRIMVGHLRVALRLREGGQANG